MFVFDGILKLWLLFFDGIKLGRRGPSKIAYQLFFFDVSGFS